MEGSSFGLPKMEVSEDSDEVVVRVFVLGFNEKDFELEVRAQTLNIEVGWEFETKDEGFFEREWKSSSFRGEVFLPCKVIPLMPKYSYDKGILEVRMRKE